MAVCKCTGNEILAETYFSALCLNHQYPQNSVAAKYKCFTVVFVRIFGACNYIVFFGNY